MATFPINKVLEMVDSVKQAGANLDEYVLILGIEPTDLYLVREKDIQT